MAEWTREGLEAVTPFDSATRQIGDEIVPMTREEYDAWIARAVGQEKPADDDPPEATP